MWFPTWILWENKKNRLQKKKGSDKRVNLGRPIF